MNLRIQRLWEALNGSYWFIPTLMSGASVALSVGLAQVDARLRREMVEEIGWIFTGGPEGARAVLSTIAGSMITVAGVAFSVLIVALSLASSQFGPRILRNFMQDRGNQVVLGAFTGTFLYCLLILRTIRGEENADFVPHLSITVAVALAIISLGVFIFFIHHSAVSIQAPVVISEIARELRHSIDRRFPDSAGVAPEGEASPLPPGFSEEATPILSLADGYLQAIDEDELLETACEHDLVMELELRPGHFVVCGTPLVRVSPAPGVTGEVCKRLQGAFSLGRQRTQTQDVEFSIRQLVEIAVRALSPSVNDPFTAINCLDYLGAAIIQMARVQLPPRHRIDASGSLRIIMNPVTFAGATDAAFDQIRQHGREDVAVTLHLLEVLAGVALSLRDPERRAVIRRHAEMVWRSGMEATPEPRDRDEVDQRFRLVLRALGEAGEPAGAEHPRSL
ncbi:MAG: DUF2254 domain-containing protein [Gemmatimonadota bacterium]|nr:DUF2254 domain-containing protein [Gemmatimonadota bacterium]